MLPITHSFLIFLAKDFRFFIWSISLKYGAHQSFPSVSLIEKKDLILNNLRLKGSKASQALTLLSWELQYLCFRLLQTLKCYKLLCQIGPVLLISLTDNSCTPSPPTPLPEGEGSRSIFPVPSPLGRGPGCSLLPGGWAFRDLVEKFCQSTSLLTYQVQLEIGRVL